MGHDPGRFQVKCLLCFNFSAVATQNIRTQASACCFYQEGEAVTVAVCSQDILVYIEICFIGICLEPYIEYGQI